VQNLIGSVTGALKEGIPPRPAVRGPRRKACRGGRSEAGIETNCPTTVRVIRRKMERQQRANRIAGAGKSTHCENAAARRGARQSGTTTAPIRRPLGGGAKNAFGGGISCGVGRRQQNSTTRRWATSTRASYDLATLDSATTARVSKDDSRDDAGEYLLAYPARTQENEKAVSVRPLQMQLSPAATKIGRRTYKEGLALQNLARCQRRARRRGSKS